MEPTHPFVQPKEPFHSSHPPSPSVVKRVFGVIWKGLTFIPLNLYYLICRVSAAVKSFFAKASEQATRSEKQISATEVKPDPGAKSEIGKVAAVGDEKLKSASDKPKDQNPAAEQSKTNPVVFEDPAVLPIDALRAMSTAVIDRTAALFPELEPANEEILSPIIIEAIQTSNELLRVEKHPLTLVTQLNEQYNILNQALADKSLSEAAKQLIETTLGQIKSRLTGIGAEILESARPIKAEEPGWKIKDIEEYIEISRCLNEQMEALKPFASKFVHTSKATHFLVQKRISEIDRHLGRINKKIGKFIKGSFKPNEKIPDDGNCMFHSIAFQLHGSTNDEKQNYYRKIAADNLRAQAFHEELGESAYYDLEFELTLQNSMDQLAHAKFNDYQKAQGGEEAWNEKLRKELKREPTFVDRYCDCLSHSKLWGGQMEVVAISRAINRSIFVFAFENVGEKILIDGEEVIIPGKTENWRLVVEQPIYNQEKPLLLFREGLHYQDLQPRF